jgi:hypothetical protein
MSHQSENVQYESASTCQSVTRPIVLIIRAYIGATSVGVYLSTTRPIVLIIRAYISATSVGAHLSITRPIALGTVLESTSVLLVLECT